MSYDRSMENKEIILNELKEISPVIANINRTNIFSVPEAYFNDLAEIILAKVHAENISFGTKASPFKIPNGYFDGLAGNILNKISQHKDQSVYEELAEIAPFLNSISKEPVYQVPEGYFESLEITIPLKLDKPSVKVFSFGNIRKTMQYALAACVAGILMFGAYMYTNQNSGNDDMVISYDSALKLNVSAELAETNEQEITAYLNEVPGVGYNVITTPSSDEINVDEYLETASDEEIKDYLNEYQETGITTTGS
jgi:hypothetical protein